MKYLSYIFLIIFYCSCSINVNGLYSNYKRTIKESSTKFKLAKDSAVCYSKENSSKEIIYITNGTILKKCIRKNKKTLIYVWSPNCKSKYCIPLEIIQQKCNENNIELFVVAEYYDTIKMNYNYDLKNNIFSIDVNHYKSNMVSKYMNLFFLDLSKEIVYNDTNNRFFIFDEGVFIKSIYAINEL
jgi:hypothetical protein